MNIKIASYNIKNGELMGYDFGILAQDILDHGLEIIGFQEVELNTTRNKNQDTMAIIAEKTGYFYHYAPAMPYRGGKFGNGLLSKYPIISCEDIKLPMSDDPTDQQRVAIHAKIDVNGTVIDFFTTHLTQCVADKQLEKISEYTKNCDRFILSGDYNYSNFDLFYDIFKGAHLAHTSLVTTIDGYKFDNFVMSPNVTCKSCNVIDTKHSDHYVLVSEITI